MNFMGRERVDPKAEVKGYSVLLATALIPVAFDLLDNLRFFLFHT